MRVDEPEELERALQTYRTVQGPSLLLVKAAIAPVEGMPRVSHSPIDIRDRFRTCVRRP
jgi:hypothetical protein